MESGTQATITLMKLKWMGDRTKTEIKEMKFKCPFCKQHMICVDDDWADSKRINGEWYGVRDLIFEHELDHIEDKPRIKSGCHGGALHYYFIESGKNSELQVRVDIEMEDE